MAEGDKIGTAHVDISANMLPFDQALDAIPAKAGKKLDDAMAGLQARLANTKLDKKNLEADFLGGKVGDNAYGIISGTLARQEENLLGKIAAVEAVARRQAAATQAATAAKAQAAAASAMQAAAEQRLSAEVAAHVANEQRAAAATQQYAVAHGMTASKLTASASAQDKLRQSGSDAAVSTMRLNAGMDGVQQSSRRGGMGMLMFAQFMDDAQYGLRGIMNQVPQLAMAMGIGPGLAGAASLAVLAFAKLGPSLEEVKLHFPELIPLIDEATKAWGRLTGAGGAAAKQAEAEAKAVKQSAKDLADVQGVVNEKDAARGAGVRKAVESMAGGGRGAIDALAGAGASEARQKKAADLIAGAMRGEADAMRGLEVAARDKSPALAKALEAHDPETVAAEKKDREAMRKETEVRERAVVEHNREVDRLHDDQAKHLEESLGARMLRGEEVGPGAVQKALEKSGQSTNAYDAVAVAQKLADAIGKKVGDFAAGRGISKDEAREQMARERDDKLSLEVAQQQAQLNQSYRTLRGGGQPAQMESLQSFMQNFLGSAQRGNQKNEERALLRRSVKVQEDQLAELKKKQAATYR